MSTVKRARADEPSVHDLAVSEDMVRSLQPVLQGAVIAAPPMRTRVAASSDAAKTEVLQTAMESMPQSTVIGSSVEEDFDGSVDPGAELLAMLASEVGVAAIQLCTTTASDSGYGQVRCPLCPWRTVVRGSEAAFHHVTEGHSRDKHYTCSGTKQLKMCICMFETDLYQGRLPGNNLKRTALILRENVLPGVSPYQDHVDRYLRVVLHADGPRFQSSSLTASDRSLRRVGNTIFTRGFAEVLLREACLCQARLEQTASRLQAFFQLQGNQFSNFMPRHTKTFALLMQYIFNSPPVTAWQTAMTESAYRCNEFDVITVDCTMKIAMGLMGYDRQGRHTGRTVDTAWGKDACLPKVITARGTTGFVVGLDTITDESGCTVAAAIRSFFQSKNHVESVRFLVVDYCSRELFVHTKMAFPNLVCICEDTVHLVMKVKSAYGNRPSSASRFLSSIMVKFNLPWSSDAGFPLLEPFCWETLYKPSTEESALHLYLKGKNLPEDLLQKALNIIKDPIPWYSYHDYILALAAFTTRYSKEMERKTEGKSKRLMVVIVAAARFTGWASCANDVLVRTHLGDGVCNIMAAGTTSNEAFHNELKGAFRQVFKFH